MTDSIVIQADYVDMAFKRGLKVARVTLEIPMEKAAWFIEKFGAPDSANPVKCAIARLDLTSVPKADDPPTPNEAPQGQGKEPRPFHTLPRSQQAGIKAADKAFQDWTQTESETACTNWIKGACGVESRKEFDTKPAAAADWDRLMIDFDQWRNEQRYGSLRR